MRQNVLWMMMLAIVAGCTSEPGEEKLKPLAVVDKRTLCFGHTLIDLPAHFYLVDGSSGSFLPAGLPEDGDPINVTMVATNASADAFAQHLAARKAAILAQAGKNTDTLSGEKILSSTAHIFTINEIKQAYSSELHALVGSNLLIVRTDSYHNQFAAGEQRLTEFLANMKPGTAAVKGEGGYCMGDIVIHGKYTQESSQLHYRSTKLPDVSIGIENNTFAEDESTSLLRRVDGPDSLLRKFDVKNHVMRKGELQVASMKAQEWLSWVMLGDDDDKKKQFGFALETMRPTPSPARPRIHLELDSGQPDSQGVQHANSLSDADATALWDFVSRSIRSRLP
jgi:hypothetical protein